MIKISVRNIDRVHAFLRTIPQGAKRHASKAFSEYIVGDSRHGLKHDDPYQQTTRKAVYGQQWKSEKQRKYVMGAISRGEIVLGQRKHSPTKASQGYAVSQTRDGYVIVNKEPGAFWSRVWNKWPRWKHTNEVIKNNMKGAMRHTVGAVNKFLRSKA